VDSQQDQGTTFTLIFSTDYEELRAAGIAEEQDNKNATTKGE